MRTHRAREERAHRGVSTRGGRLQAQDRGPGRKHLPAPRARTPSPQTGESTRFWCLRAQPAAKRAPRIRISTCALRWACLGRGPLGAMGKEFLRHPARLLPSLCRTRCSLPWAGPVPFCQAWGENRIEMWVSSRLGKEGASPFIVGGEATQDPSGRRGRAESCAFLNRSLF